MGIYYDEWDDSYKDSERNWGDDDDEPARISLKERQAEIDNMRKFANEENTIRDVNEATRQELINLTNQVQPIIEECIKLEDENNEISDKNQKTLTETEKLVDEIKQKLQELDELEAEIDAELSEVDQALKNALNAKPQDEKLIAELKQRQAELQGLKQECIADRKRLNESLEQATQVKRQCTTISERSAAVAERANTPSRGPTTSAFFNRGPLGSKSDNNNNNNNNNNQSSAFSGGPIVPLTPTETCDLYTTVLTELKEEMTELRDYMAEEVGELNELSSENEALLDSTKSEVKEVSQTMQSRRERFNEMKSERANKMEKPPQLVLGAPKTSAPAINASAQNSVTNAPSSRQGDELHLEKPGAKPDVPHNEM